MKNYSFSSRISIRFKSAWMQILAKVFGKVLFKDKFGLKYYLWPDTRIDQACELGARTDDIGAIYQINKIMDRISDKSEMTCIDVGAFIGVISIAMASKMSGRGRVFSFEPSTKTFSRLSENIKVSGSVNVTAINKAVSGIAEGNVSFQTMKEAGGNHIIVENPTMSELKSAKERVEIISTDTIDAFATLNGIQSIDIMKIDAEGYDDRVIDGAKSFFRKGLVKYVVCEYNQGDVCSEGCVDRLRKFGYAVYFMVRNKDLLVRSLDDYPFDKHKRSLNLLAVSPQIPISQIEENFNVQGRKLEKQA